MGDILKSFNEPLEEIKSLVDIWLASHFILRILIFVLVDGDLLLRSFDQVGVGDDLALVACPTIVWTFHRLFFGFGHFSSSNVRLVLDFYKKATSLKTYLTLAYFIGFSTPSVGGGAALCHA